MPSKSKSEDDFGSSFDGLNIYLSNLMKSAEDPNWPYEFSRKRSEHVIDSF